MDNDLSIKINFGENFNADNLKSTLRLIQEKGTTSIVADILNTYIQTVHMKIEHGDINIKEMLLYLSQANNMRSILQQTAAVFQVNISEDKLERIIDKSNITALYQDSNQENIQYLEDKVSQIVNDIAQSKDILETIKEMLTENEERSFEDQNNSRDFSIILFVLSLLIPYFFKSLG